MPYTLFIKNMVCQRCIMTVEKIFSAQGIPVHGVRLGEVELANEPGATQLERLNVELKKVGFEIIESRITKIIENIRLLVLEYLNSGPDTYRKKLSSFITAKIPNDYSYLSDLFSSVEGQTIEQFFIISRIEKVKELIVYDQLSLTEIAFQTGFSSVHHLSSQFKKVTGLTPSHFRKIGAERRRVIK